MPQYDSPVVGGVRQGRPWLARGVNNFRDFMEVGVLSTNNVSVSSSGDNHDVRLSVAASDSPELGLSIVQHICAYYGFRVRYGFAADVARHTLRVEFA